MQASPYPELRKLADQIPLYHRRQKTGEKIVLNKTWLTSLLSTNLKRMFGRHKGFLRSCAVTAGLDCAKADKLDHIRHE
jgi:hypothetical protein